MIETPRETIAAVLAWLTNTLNRLIDTPWEQWGLWGREAFMWFGAILLGIAIISSVSQLMGRAAEKTREWRKRRPPPG